MKQSQRIAKNVLAGGLAVGLGGVVQLLAVAIIGRSVSPTDFGTYSSILAFATFFWLLADAGLSNILVREIATQPTKMAEIFGATLSLIWALSIAAELLIVVVVSFLPFGLPLKLTALMGVATLTQFHCAGYGALLVAHEDNELQALGFMLHKVFFLGFIILAFQAGSGLLGVTLAHVVPNLLLWFFYRQIVKRRYGHPKLRWDPALWKHLLTHSIPVGGASMLRVLAQQIDILILTWLTNPMTVGLFSGPYRISMALRFVPQSMSTPLYPMFSRLAGEAQKRAELEEAYQRSIKFFLLVALPFATLFLMASDRFVTGVFDARYAAAAPAMQWLSVAFVPFFLASPLPFLLTALHQQRYLLVSSAFTVGLRIALNVTLIPVLGFLGPCLAFLVSEALTVTLWVNKLSRLGFHLHFAAISWRFVLACAIMVIPLFLTRQRSLWYFAPGAILSIFVYGTAIVKLRALSVTDLSLMREGMGFLKPFLARRAKQAPNAAA